MALFPSFLDQPAKFAFANQDDDEFIELVLRRHLVTNLSWIFPTLIGAILPFLWPFFGRFLMANLSLNIPPDIVFSLLVLWYLLILAYVLEHFLNWYFNVDIVTNKHLISVDFHSMLSRTINECLLSDVQSISTPVRGVLGGLFYFGHVIVETSGHKQNIEFFSVPKPDLVAERIQNLQETQQENNHAH